MRSVKTTAVMAAFFGVLTAWAGAGGAGNTGDVSVQFDFARGTAVAILQSVGSQAVYEASGRSDIRSLYESCRQPMFVGVVRTRFELVPSIPDGEGFHALAQRLPNATIRISRTEMEKLQAAGALNGPFLTSVVLHEVGHDCIINGVALGDDFDQKLNLLAEALIRAAGNQSAAHLIDLAFIDRVKSGEAVRFLDLSSRVRQKLTQKYLDYAGDWAFLKFRPELGPERPAPASDFFADARTSVFPGWSSVAAARGAGAATRVAEQLLAASVSSGGPSYFGDAGPGAKSKPLPTLLTCVPLQQSEATAVSCELQVSWEPLRDAVLSRVRQEIRFELDLFGNLRITRVRMLE